MKKMISVAEAKGMIAENVVPLDAVEVEVEQMNITRLSLVIGKAVEVEHSLMTEPRLILGLLQKASDLVMDQFKPMLLAKD